MIEIILFGFLAAAQVSVNDTFQSYGIATWGEGVAKGNWITEYNGYGRVGIQYDIVNGVTSTNRVLYQKPLASTSPDETHASLVLTRKSYKPSSITVRSKVVKQLRTPVPKPWETAWVVWNYQHDHRFYYFALKTNGWELGKVDNTKINPNGPECLWPEYLNCKYEGAQRYLRTSSSPKVVIGQWANIRVDQVNNVLTVYVNNVKVVSFTDNETPYRTGYVGLYNEDAHVRFDNISITSVP
jgi:Domain of Unknown Function (DUF1080)